MRSIGAIEAHRSPSARTSRAHGRRALAGRATRRDPSPRARAASAGCSEIHGSAALGGTNTPMPTRRRRRNQGDIARRSSAAAMVAHGEVAPAEARGHRSACTAPHGRPWIAARDLHHQLAGAERAEEHEQRRRAGPQQPREPRARTLSSWSTQFSAAKLENAPSNRAPPRRVALVGELAEPLGGERRAAPARAASAASRARSRTIAGAPSVSSTSRPRAESQRASSPVPPPISSTRAPRGKARASSVRTSRRCAATLRHAPKRASNRAATASNAWIAGDSAAGSCIALADRIGDRGGRVRAVR